jgi:hypothetical protein
MRGQHELAAESPTDGHAMETMLSNLLADAFEGRVARLRQWIRDSVGRQASWELPGDGASLSELAFQAMLSIRRHAGDRKKLFESLRDELPGMVERVQEVARHWGAEIARSVPKRRRTYGTIAAIVMLGILAGVVIDEMASDVQQSRRARIATFSLDGSGEVTTSEQESQGVAMALELPSTTRCEVEGDVDACWTLAQEERDPAVASKYWSRACELDESGASCRRKFEFCSSHQDLPECKHGIREGLEHSRDERH